MLTQVQDRAIAIQKDFETDKVNGVTTSDVEQIAQQIDHYEAMTLLRYYGGAYFAQTEKGVSKKAKEAASKNFLLYLGRFLKGN